MNSPVPKATRIGFLPSIVNYVHSERRGFLANGFHSQTERGCIGCICALAHDLVVTTARVFEAAGCADLALRV